MAAPNRATLFDPTVTGAHLAHTAGVGEIFLAFLSIGATSVGGEVMAYLRSSMVEKHRWLNDSTFVELMIISQMVPGLKAVNLAVLIGDRLRGTAGALAALLGICLPRAFLMYIVGIVYQIERDRPLLDAALAGVAPAAVGLLLATALELGRKSLAHIDDLIFVVLTVICVNRLHMHIVSALLIQSGLICSRASLRRKACLRKTTADCEFATQRHDLAFDSELETRSPTAARHVPVPIAWTRRPHCGRPLI